VHPSEALAYYPITQSAADVIDHGDRVVLPARYLQTALDHQDQRGLSERPCYRLTHRDDFSGQERVCFGGVLAYFPGRLGRGHFVIMPPYSRSYLESL
jgi:hypothetical protein